MSGPAVFFYVQHLLGIGHLRRATLLTRALSQAGLDVTLVSGGMPVGQMDLAGAAFVQLPPLRAADQNFKNLVDEYDQPIDETWRTRRRDALLDAFRQRQPRALMTELFPFGRWQMRFELLPLLDMAFAARERPLILSSVRDILVPSTKPGRAEEMADLAERYFDRVLVHGDPALIAFEQTFPLAGRIRERISYTGYVVERNAASRDPNLPGFGEVIVSAGGGAVGASLFAAAVAARPLTGLRDATWRLLVSMGDGGALLSTLRSEAPPGVVVEPARADFTALLANCRLSISQAGYNTLMELLQARTPSVVVPYSGSGETEQTLRAHLLAGRGWLQMVAETALTPVTLGAAAERALAAPGVAAFEIDMSGAQTTARLVRQWAEARA